MDSNAKVWSIDLERVANLLNVTERDLVEGLAKDGDAVYARAEESGQASADAVAIGYTPPPSTARVKQALLSTVSRASVGCETGGLPAAGLPPALRMVGGKPFIVQQLRQLVDAGILRLVLVVGGRDGGLVADAARRSPLSKYISIEVVDLGPAFSDGHGASLLRARAHFEPESELLLCTADHLHEAELVKGLVQAGLPGEALARVLVETDAAYYSRADLPPTAARVALDEQGLVAQIGRGLSADQPLEAGLFLAHARRLFNAMSEVRERSADGYFSLVEALELAAQRRALLAHSTQGMLWCAAETVAQLRTARTMLSTPAATAPVAAGVDGAALRPSVGTVPSAGAAAAAGPVVATRVGSGSFASSASAGGGALPPPVERALGAAPAPARPTAPAGGSATPSRTSGASGGDDGARPQWGDAPPPPGAGVTLRLGLGVEPPRDLGEQPTVGALDAEMAARALALGELPAQPAVPGPASAAEQPAEFVRGVIIDANRDRGGDSRYAADEAARSLQLVQPTHAIMVDLPVAAARPRAGEPEDGSDDAPPALPPRLDRVRSLGGTERRMSIGGVIASASSTGPGAVADPPLRTAGPSTGAEAFLIEMPDARTGAGPQHLVTVFNTAPPPADAPPVSRRASASRLSGAARMSGAATSISPDDGSAPPAPLEVSVPVSGDDDVHAFLRRIGLPPLPSGIDSITISARPSVRRELVGDTPTLVRELPTVALSGAEALASDPSVLPVTEAAVIAPFDVSEQQRELLKPGAAAERDAAEVRESTGVQIEVTVTRKVPLVGYVIVGVALFAAASLGHAFHFLGAGVGGLLTLHWRFASISVAFCAPAVSSIAFSSKLRATLLTRRVAWLFLGASLGTTIQSACFNLALYSTSTANALMFNNLTPVLLLGLKLYRRERLGALEVGGALVALLSGAIVAVVANDEAAAAAAADADGGGGGEAGADGSGVSGGSPLLGNAIAFLGSFGAMGYILANEKLRPLMPAPVQFGLINVLGALYCVPPLLAGAEGELTPFDFSRKGLFGWLRPETDRLLVAVYIALVADGIGAMGWVVALKYLSPLVISVVILMMPIAATIEGVAIGITPMPSLVSALASLTLIVGAVGVVLASAGAKEDKVDATSTLGPTAAAGASAAPTPALRTSRPDTLLEDHAH